uniref:Uncharacterized protein n=1 Tax=Schlesneria paludicola TaxID=360056 RepID=A0A7C2P3W8_9PLAN
MRALGILRNLRCASAAALLAVFFGGLAPAQAVASDLMLHLQLHDPETDQLSWTWHFQGEVDEDRFVIGEAATISIGPHANRVVGTSAGYVDENGTLTLAGPQPDDYVILYTGNLLVDLASGAAAWVNVNGDVLLVGWARVTVSE